MADFVHCHKCFTIPDGTGSRKYYISSCGHLFCQVCVGLVTGMKSQCKVCGITCELKEINNKISPDMQAMFMDPMQLAKKHHRQLAECMNFQKSNRVHYIGFLHQQLKKARKMTEILNGEMKKKQVLERENQTLKQEAEQLRQQLRSRIQTTPRPSPVPMRMYRNHISRSAITVDSEMPAGATASNYRENPRSNFVGGSPYSEMASPNASRIGFPGFQGHDPFSTSPNTAIPAAVVPVNPYRAVWGDHMSAVTLDSRDTPRPTHQAQRAAIRAHNSSRNGNGGITALMGRRG